MQADGGYWNTHHPLGMNRIVRFPELYELRFSVYAPASHAYSSKFYFLEHFADAGNALRAGTHTPDCSYADAEFSFAGFIFRLEFSHEQGNLACLLTPIAVADPNTLVLVQALRAWELDGQVELEKDNVISFKGGDGIIRITAFQDFCSIQNPGTPASSGIYASEDDLLQALLQSGALNGTAGKGRMAALAFPARMPLYLTAHQENDNTSIWRPNADSIKKQVDAARVRCEQTSPSIHGGPFQGCCHAVSSVMNWMTVWDQSHGLPYSPVSRSWIDNYMVKAGFDPAVRGPLTGLWDSFFHGILQSVNDRNYAESNLRVALGDHALLEEGYPPNYMVSAFLSGDRSQPPLASLAAWKIFRRFHNIEFLEWIYPRLVRWRKWWRARRDGNSDGLLEWGSDGKTSKPGNDAGTLFAAKCESGMDNCPIYDDAEYDHDTGTMSLTDVGLNSFFAADALFLAKIAGVLGKTEDKEALEQQHANLARKINEVLWNEEAGTYQDRFWDGRFSSRLGPTSFYPLFARIPTPERAASIVHSHLLNEQEFWGEYVIPTISRNDSAFRDQLYWRGRVWPPVNYLVYLGLKAYGFDHVAHELALRSVRLFMHEWNLRGHCHENYNAITGEADDVPIPSSPCSNGSDRFYPWGALLPLMGIEELFDVEPDYGVRFGCMFLEEETELRNVPYGNAAYRIIASSSRTIAIRDDREFYSSVPGTNVGHFESNSQGVSFSVTGTGDTLIKISGFDKFQPLILSQQGHVVAHLRADGQGSISFNLTVDEHPRNIMLVADGEKEELITRR